MIFLPRAIQRRSPRRSTQGAGGGGGLGEVEADDHLIGAPPRGNRSVSLIELPTSSSASLTFQYRHPQRGRSSDLDHLTPTSVLSMIPTSVTRGASRLPLTTKRGNKDFYKGTRQAVTPGAGPRTGAPGKHVIRGKAKYRLLDSRVRVFVGPGIEAIESSSSDLSSSRSINPRPPLSLPSSSPHPQQLRARQANPQLKPYVSSKATVPEQTLPPFGPWPKTSSGVAPQQRDFKHFSKAYNALSPDERNALIMQARREWYAALTSTAVEKGQQEAHTQEVEGQAKQ
ncbi:hypothetical protein A1Q2_06500 [Trichosporon asahii var. asahii CBS 8904]|uniref:Uncharacterized protein n=1 Tax=Trichosporon asahii var. asahii (strain CBS 8904) TaxID=1220162 RepID=K1VEN5_TRIAC|nr:hypothetical protein A1Q2_06500 [Trichosporon asahii var. asahii CBS 8904]